MIINFYRSNNCSALKLIQKKMMKMMPILSLEMCRQWI